MTRDTNEAEDLLNAMAGARILQAVGIPIAIAVGAFVGAPFVGGALRLFRWAAGL